MYYVRIDFTCLKVIDHILFYSGVQWYGCISNSIKPFLKKNQYNVLPSNAMGVIPVQNGVSRYNISDHTSCIIFFDDLQKRSVLNWLKSIKTEPILKINPNKSCQFTINGSIAFLKAVNLLDKDEFSEDSLPISDDIFSEELEALSDLDELTLLFITPLRLKRPDEFKKPRHKFFDEDFFDIQLFINSLKDSFLIQDPIVLNLTIIKQNLKWVDMVYKNSIGGLMGSLVIKGHFSKALLEILVKGQYLGLGKNKSLGFGQYRIKESNQEKSIDYR